MPEPVSRTRSRRARSSGGRFSSSAPSAFGSATRRSAPVPTAASHRQLTGSSPLLVRRNVTRSPSGETRSARGAPIGVTGHRCLGGAGRWRDSVMMGLPDNDDPRCFWQANVAEAAASLTEVIREVEADVIVTYDANGFYGHPDHIQAHRVALRAFDAAGDPARYPEQGLAPWAPQKLYYTTVPRSAMATFAQRLREAGLESPLPEDAAEITWGS